MNATERPDRVTTPVKTREGSDEASVAAASAVSRQTAMRR